jgi:hypothetical protein
MRFPTKRIALLCVIPLVMVSMAMPAEDKSDPDQGYLKHTFSPKSIVRTAAAAGISQATDTPHEWGQGAIGFGRRFANAFGKHIIRKTIQYPVARLLHEEISYRRSDKTGFGPRLEYALLRTVITQKATTGERTLAVGEISGAVGSGLISRLWQPASTRSIAAGFGSAGITMGVDAGLNVVREFWPEIRHPHRHVNAPAPPAQAAIPAESLPVTPVAGIAILDENGSPLQPESSN